MRMRTPKKLDYPTQNAIGRPSIGSQNSKNMGEPSNISWVQKEFTRFKLYKPGPPCIDVNILESYLSKRDNILMMYKKVARAVDNLAVNQNATPKEKLRRQIRIRPTP
jgi:hypothetical protein